MIFSKNMRCTEHSNKSDISKDSDLSHNFVLLDLASGLDFFLDFVEWFHEVSWMVFSIMLSENLQHEQRF